MNISRSTGIFNLSIMYPKHHRRSL